MKKSKLILTSLLLVLCMLMALVSCRVESNNDKDDQTPATPAYAYVAIDINPSLELVIDESNVVVSVNACNDDALVLLSGEEIAGLSVEEATEKIVGLAKELGYLNDENTDVNFTVVAAEEGITAQLETKLENGAKKGSAKAIIKFGPKEELKQRVEEIINEHPELEEKIEAGKLRLIEAIQSFDEDFTIDEGLELDTRELAKMLSELKKELDEKTPQDVKKAANEHFKQLKEETRRKIASVYGEDFFKMWESNEELEKAYEELKAEYENLLIASEDVLAVEELLEIDLSEFKEQDGSIKLCTLKEEIKASLMNCAREAYEQVMELIKAYENELLASEDLQAIINGFKDFDYGCKPSEPGADKEEDGAGDVEATPDDEQSTTPNDTTTEEAKDFESFEDFEGFVKGEFEKFEEYYDDVELDESQREEIKGYKDEMKGSIDKLRNELDEINQEFEKYFPNKKGEQ